jgi:peptidoglycan/LPS O-acetylase OafA/YrhL
MTEQHSDDRPAAGEAGMSPALAPALSSGSRRSTYYPHIDGLRAIAVIAVIVYHLQATWLPGGFGGVDVFFVVSGFVVSASVGNWNRGGIAAFFGYFYARRMQRIAPALIACLLLTGLAAMLFIPSAWLSTANETTGLYAFFGLSNFFLATHRESYFSPTVDFNPYTHTWSLGVEEQFYLLFPLLFFAWILSARTRRWSTALFTIALLGSMAWAWWLARTDAAAAFYLITSRFWELACGVLLYQGLVRAGHRFDESARAPTRVSNVGAWLALGVLGIGMAVGKPSQFPFPGALLPVVGTLGLLGFLHGRVREGLLLRTLGSAPLVYVGRISYSLYLWHWPVFVLMRWTFGLESILCRALAVVLTFALAAASFRFIEQPLRYSPRLRRWPRRNVIAAGALTIVTCWWLSMQITALRPVLSLSTVARHAADWYPHAVDTDIAHQGCTLGTQVANVGGGMLAIYTRAGCAAPAQPGRRVFAIGDSHAMAYSTLLTDYVLQTGATVFLYSNGGCPFLSLQPERERGACPTYAAAAIADMLRRARAGDVLFLSSLRLARFSNQFAPVSNALAWALMSGPAATAGRRMAETAAIATLAPFAAKGMRIVLEAPKPIFRAPPFRCADWFDDSNPICRPGLTMSKRELQRFRKPVLDAFARIAARIPAVNVWDPFPLLCPGDVCAASRDGRPLFFDGDHLSGYGNRLLLPSFEHDVALAGGAAGT